MNFKSFKHGDWVKIYDGKWSFLTSSYFGDQYTKELMFGPRPFMPQTIILGSHNRSSGWVRQKDRDILGKYLSGQITKNPKLAKEISNKLRYQATTFLKFIDENIHKPISEKVYKAFWERLLAYYHPHINVKYVVDYLDPKLLKKYLPAFQAARLAAEPALNRTEDFLTSFAKQQGKKAKYNFELILCLNKQEINIYFKTGKLPKKQKLEQRFKRFAFLHNELTSAFYSDNFVDKIEGLLVNSKKISEIKGQSAFGGKVKGKVRIVLDPKKTKGFKVGEILVTGATRPEFLPIMHKAAAFVTDTGGILSHAAITAREMKKPCVIGTKIATKVFKDGDIIEVDATKGLVRKVN